MENKEEELNVLMQAKNDLISINEIWWAKTHEKNAKIEKHSKTN